MSVIMCKQPPSAPTASAVGLCPTVIQIVERLGSGSLPSTIAPPDLPFPGTNGFRCIHSLGLATMIFVNYMLLIKERICSGRKCKK